MAWLTEKQLQSFKRVGRGVKISDQALIYGAHNIEVGDNVRIDAHTIILATHGSLKIGSHVHVAVQCLFSCGGGISLGDFTSISMGSKLISASDDSSGDWLVGPNHPPNLIKVRKEIVVVDHYAWLGTNAVMLPGSKASQGALLGVNGVAVFGQVLAPWAISLGNPAAFWKARSQEMVVKSQEAMEIFEREWMEAVQSPWPEK